MDESAKCASDATFGANTKLAKDVQIAKESKFGPDLQIDEETYLGPNVTTGKGVHIGKFVCTQGHISIGANKKIPDWRFVFISATTKALVYRKPPIGYKYVLESAKCVLKEKFAAAFLPDNGHLVRCQDITKSDATKDNVKCGADVTFAGPPRLMSGVAIGHGCEFGKQLTVGEGTDIGDFVSSDKDVIIGKHACIEGRLHLEDAMRIDDFAMVGRDKDNNVVVTRAPDGQMF